MRAHRRRHHSVGIPFALRPAIDDFDLGIAVDQLRRERIEFRSRASREGQLGSAKRQCPGGRGAQCAGRARDERRLAAHIEQVAVVGQRALAGYGMITIIDAGRFVRFSIDRASLGAR